MSHENRYTLLERMLHRFGFASGTAQLGLADLESKRFQKELQGFTPGAPVLITGLPRAGTTILLEALAAIPPFAAHTYRDMPFVLCPMLWAGFAGKRGRSDAKRERAHGDGIAINQDSPEAFEEMVWMRFFKNRYRGDCLPVWTRCDGEEFGAFYREHQRKIIALRRRGDGDGSERTRYVAKNNLLIARLPAVWQALPDAIALVPFRDPLQHAASLLRQHERFTAMHKEDPFIRRYMAGIGHFDFGANLKPVDFDGWWSQRTDRDPTTLGFWLDYWRATYRHLLRVRTVGGGPGSDRAAGRMHLVCFEDLRADADLTALAAAIGCRGEAASRVQERAAILSSPADRDVPTDGLDPDAVADARALHGNLKDQALALPTRSPDPAP